MDHHHVKCDRIAVYGTLRKGQGAYRSFGLEHALKFIDTTQVPGLMYHMGGYPGIKLLGFKEERTSSPPPLITVDLFEIKDEYIVRRLDSYEGCHERDPDDGLYRRVLTTTVNGLETWIYEINGPMRPERLIKSGDWLRQDEQTAA